MIRIRPARPADASWITALAPRLHAFGPPPWREVESMDRAVVAGLTRALAEPSEGSAILVAEADSGTPLGFASLQTDRDYFTGRPVGHLSDLVVDPAGEGRGVARALLGASEEWAREAGYPWLTLHVFADNERARRVYEHYGFSTEWIRMLKPLPPRRAR